MPDLPAEGSPPAVGHTRPSGERARPKVGHPRPSGERAWPKVGHPWRPWRPGGLSQNLCARDGDVLPVDGLPVAGRDELHAAVVRDHDRDRARLQRAKAIRRAVPRADVVDRDRLPRLAFQVERAPDAPELGAGAARDLPAEPEDLEPVREQDRAVDLAEGREELRHLEHALVERHDRRQRRRAVRAPADAVGPGVEARPEHRELAHDREDERAVAPPGLVVAERVLQADRPAVARHGRDPIARQEEQRAAVVRVAHRRDEALHHLLGDLSGDLGVERHPEPLHGRLVVREQLAAESDEPRREPLRLERVHRRALDLAAPELGEDDLAQGDRDSPRTDRAHDDGVARHGGGQGTPAARALEPARPRLEHPPDFERPGLRVAHADERAGELRGRREPPDLVLVEPPRLVEAQAVQPLGRTDVGREPRRVAHEEPEAHRALLLLEEGRLVGHRDEVLELRRVGQLAAVRVARARVAHGPELAPAEAGELGELGGVGVGHRLRARSRGTASTSARGSRSSAACCSSDRASRRRALAKGRAPRACP